MLLFCEWDKVSATSHCTSFKITREKKLKRTKWNEHILDIGTRTHSFKLAGHHSTQQWVSRINCSGLFWFSIPTFFFIEEYKKTKHNQFLIRVQFGALKQKSGVCGYGRYLIVEIKFSVCTSSRCWRLAVFCRCFIEWPTSAFAAAVALILSTQSNACTSVHKQIDPFGQFPDYHNQTIERK